MKLTLAAKDFKEPLHARVRQVLRGHILTDFQHGERFYSEREMVKELGVSQTTLRRALADLANEGYLSTDPRRGFFVRHHSDTRYVGLITPMAGIPQGRSEINAEFTEACIARNYTIVFHPLYRDAKVRDIIKSIVNKPIEERIVIIGMTVQFTLELTAWLQSKGYRHLVFGARPPGFMGDCLFRDQDSEVDQVIDHLTSLGHEHIVFMVNEPKALLLTSYRVEAVKRKIEQRKLKKVEIIFCDTKNWESSYDAAYRKTQEILQRKNRPTAIVPLSGTGSWAAYRAITEGKVTIPGEISVLSFDPMANSDILPVPMTELEFAHGQVAYKAIDLLWSDSTDPINVGVTPTLIPRDSTGPAAKPQR